MAERKPLFIDTDGFPEEMATTDTGTFGGLTLNGLIDMGDNPIINLEAGDAPGEALSFAQTGATLSGLNVSNNLITNLSPGVSGTDAVNKDQLDAVSSSGIIAGSGLINSSGETHLNVGDGIHVVADRATTDLFSTGGLQFIGSTPNGELSLLLDETPDTLDLDGDGLKVIGLPSQFKVNDVTVSVNVTAANLDILTDGSNADSLHTHSGIAVTEAQRTENLFTVDTAQTVVAGDPVFISSADKVSPCDNNNDNCKKIIGVARTGGSAGAVVEVASNALIQGVLSGATPGLYQYIDTPNGLTETRPTTPGAIVVIVGKSSNTTDLMMLGQWLGKVAS